MKIRPLLATTLMIFSTGHRGLLRGFNVSTGNLILFMLCCRLKVSGFCWLWLSQPTNKSSIHKELIQQVLFRFGLCFYRTNRPQKTGLSSQETDTWQPKILKRKEG